MSLKQQLSWLTSGIVLIMLLGNLSLTLVQSKQHFEQLLNARAYDAATSLALSLTQQTQANPVQQQRVIDVLFDRGFFSEIKLVRTDGVNVERLATNLSKTQAPEWFKNLFLLEVMPAKTNVSRGWSQLGELTVKSHTDIAYNDLWSMFLAEIKWFSLVLILSLVGLQLVLRLLLKPLKQAEAQAVSISEKHWVKQESIPSTREFKSLALAMNHMVDKLRSIFDVQAQASERLRKQSFEDNLTGVLNRHGFDKQLTHVLESQDEHSGFLMILHLQHFAQYNQQYGRERGDELLVRVANGLKDYFKRSPATLIGRHRGADFALYVPCVDKLQAEESINKLTLQLSDLKALIKPTELLMGAVFLQDQTDSLNNVLSQADFALRQAQKTNTSSLLHSGSCEQERLTASQWRDKLLDVIKQDGVEIEYLPVFDTVKQNPMQFEVLSRIQLMGEQLSGARFWPMVEFHKLSAEFDLQVLKKLARHFDRLPKGYRYCVNLAHSSVSCADFQENLCEFLNANPLLAKSLAIEISETVINEHEKALSILINRLNPIGVEFGVDKFGTGKQSFAYLKRLNISYLRIDGGLNRGVYQSQDHQFYIQSMVQIAHSLDIKIIAEGLEDERDIEVIKQVGINNISGFYFSKTLSVDDLDSSSY